MLIYKIGDQKFRVSPEDQEAFEAENPDAQLISDEFGADFESQIDTETPVQEPQPLEQDISMPGDPGVIQTPMGLASTEDAAPDVITEEAPEEEEPTEEKPTVKPLYRVRDEAGGPIKWVFNVNGEKLKVGENDIEAFLEAHDTTFDELNFGDGDLKEESDIPFDQRIKDDDGVSAITNKLSQAKYRGSSLDSLEKYTNIQKADKEEEENK